MRGIGFGSLYPGMVGMSRGRRSSSNPMSGVTKDATSSIFCPSSSTEWTTTMSAAGLATGNPSFLWLMQNAASPEPETFGTGVTLATSGTAGTFAATQSGWSRKGWKSAGDNSVGRLLSTSTSLPDPTTTSALVIAYVAILSTPAAERQVLSVIGSSPSVYGSVTTTPAAKVYDSTNNATGTSNVGTVVRPWVVKYNHTSSVTTLYTDQDKISPTFTAGSGKAIAIGEVSTGAPSMWCGYATLFTGTAAELTDAQVKALLQTLGWTIAWT